MPNGKVPVSQLFGGNTLGCIAFLALSLCCPSGLFAGAITLGSAQSFAVLGGAGVTVAAPSGTVVSGSIGDYPDTFSSITGYPAYLELLNGSFYYNASGGLPAVAQQAQADENTAYTALSSLPTSMNETGIIMGSGGTVSTLLPGVYTFANTSAQVDGMLTLDFQNASNAIFVFQIGTTLTTGSGAEINVINANPTDAIYWQVGSSATLGSGTSFAGNILASASITLGTGASILCGRAFADTGAVSMDGTNLISDNCGLTNTSTGYSSAGATDFGSYGFSGVSQVSSVPEPGTFLLLGISLGGFLLKYSAGTRQTRPLRLGRVAKVIERPLLTI